MVSNPIYLATGWMFPYSETTRELQTAHDAYESLIDGYELHPTTPTRIEQYTELNLPESLSYTIHATPTQTKALTNLLTRTKPDTVVYHPTAALSTDRLTEFYADRTTTPTIENLDGSYDQTDSEELLDQCLKEQFGFTLDIQHIYDHDETMRYGYDLCEQYGTSVTQAHISGHSTNTTATHELVHQSDNRERITSFIKEFTQSHPEVPLVIEGEYETLAEIENEVDYLRQL